ncbi:hypothetical protein ACFX1S_025768 [Malus domestica]
MFKSQKARDAKDRLETVASQAQKMNDIVTEQWIQIQRLEQAFHSTQDDAHIFCRKSQVKDEVKGVLHFIQYTYNIFGFGFSFDLKLSTVNRSYYAVYAVRFTISYRYEQHGKVKEEVIKLKEQFSHLKSLVSSCLGLCSSLSFLVGRQSLYFHSFIWDVVALLMPLL